MDQLEKEDNICKLAKKILYSDLIQVIAKQSSLKDIMTLAQLYPPRKRILQKIFRERIIARIDGWFRNYFTEDKYNEFVNAMIKEKAVISGSFIIQMILNEKWVGSDIDIFIHAQNYFKGSLPEKYSSLRHGNAFSFVEHVIYSDMTLEDYDVANGNFNLENEDDLSDGGRLAANGGPIRYRKPFGNKYYVRTLREYPLVKSREETLAKFQTIVLHKKSDDESDKSGYLLEFIENAFDFDICKNSFQYLLNANGKVMMKLKLSKPIEILDRVAGFKITNDLRSTLARCKKYMARGFKFYDDIANSVSLNDDPLARNYKNKNNLARQKFDLLISQETSKNP